MRNTYLTDTQFSARYDLHHGWPWRGAKLDPNFPQPVSLMPGRARRKLTGIEAWEAVKPNASGGENGGPKEFSILPKKAARMSNVRECRTAIEIAAPL